MSRRAIAWSLLAVALLVAVTLVGWGLVESGRGALRNAILVDTLPTENTVQTPELEAADRMMLGGAALAGAGSLLLVAAALGAHRLRRGRAGDVLGGLPGEVCGACGHPWAVHPGAGGADACSGCAVEDRSGARLHRCRRDVRDVAAQARRYVERSFVLTDALFSGHERGDLHGESDRFSRPTWEWLIELDVLVSGLHSAGMWEPSPQSARRRVEFVSGVDALVDRRPADFDDPHLLTTLAELRSVVVGFSAI